jgi:transposase InsO family protein
MGSEEVARLFRDHAFPYTGIPKKIISDRDMRFTSQFFKELCDQLDIKQNMSSAYHPQTDGQSERTNQTLETILRIYCNYQQDNWADWLKIAQYIINCHPSSTTKKPPYELWMGFIPRTHQPTRVGNVPALEERKSKLLQARNDAQEAISKAQSLWQKSPHFLRYHVDQQVWLEGTHLRTTHPTHKLRAKRFGPFKVLEVLSPVTYRLELPASWKIHNAFHAAVLHPYKETAIHGPNFPEPPPDLVKGQEEWEVDNVLASRRFGRNKTLQYLVKWKGFSEAHNSWEPKGNLRNAGQLVQEFHNKNPRAIRRMVINPTSIDMSSQPLPDISSLIHHFENLSLMSTQETTYPSPSASERQAILAVDTEVVAQVVSDIRHTDTPPPVFPEEPEYMNPTEPPPDFEISDYLRLSPSLVSVHGPSRPPTPLTIMTAAMEADQENNVPLPVLPRLGEHEYYAAQQVHPNPADNPQDPHNLLTGTTEQQCQQMFRSVNGLRDAILTLIRREDEEEVNAPSLAPPTIAPEMLAHRRPATPSTESSVTSSAPSHLSILVDGENDVDTHPGEDWIRFIPEIHRTGTLIPINEAYPEERVQARYIRFHIDQITGEPTISGTMGRGCPIYGDTLMAAPVPDPAPANHRDHRYFEMFEEQSMICGPVNRALEDLGDYGILGDVIRYRGQTAQR